MNKLIGLLFLFSLSTSNTFGSEQIDVLTSQLKTSTNSCEKIKMSEFQERLTKFEDKIYSIISEYKKSELKSIMAQDDALSEIFMLYGYSYLPDNMDGTIAKSCGVYYTEFLSALKENKETQASISINSWRNCLKTHWGKEGFPELASPIILCYKNIK